MDKEELKENNINDKSNYNYYLMLGAPVLIASLIGLYYTMRK
jgi:hypothetical protein